MSKCTGSNYPAIRATDLAQIVVTIPKLNEQQKIADCLSYVDNLIVAQSNKVEALTKHKKALMQQLFPRDVEDKS